MVVNPALSEQRGAVRAGAGVSLGARSRGAGASRRRYLAPALYAVVLFILALGPRWANRDVFMTSDEDSWMRRAGGFAYGLSHGLPGRTYQNGHPGVVTMELAILGQGPGGAERFADPVTGARLVTRVPGFFAGLVEARRAFAVASALLVSLLGLIAWRLLGAGPALVGGLLLALDPFLLAHSQLVHTDALLAGLVATAVGCALVRWGSGGGSWWVVAGGILSGLALLAKVPAIFLAAYVPLVALATGRQRARRSLIIDLSLWLLAGVTTYVLFWPSLWINPVSTLARMIDFTRETGGQPDEVGSFFLGQAWGDPGPLFYPVALAFRLTPAVGMGLLLLAGLAWPLRRLLAGRRLVLLGLIGYALGFLVFISIGQKKFDRYALPIVPVLLLLAGLGWRLLYCRMQTLLAVKHQWPLAGVCLMLVGVFQWSAVASVSPYYMAYFNPLLGGGPAAARTVMIGNGEGMDQVAEYFNAMPDADQLWVASHSFDLLQAQCVCDGEPLRERPPGNADYLVLYGRRIQLRRWGASLEQYLAAHDPVHRVWINGMEMARVYRGPRLEKGAPG